MKTSLFAVAGIAVTIAVAQAPPHAVTITPAGGARNDVATTGNHWSARGFDLKSILAVIFDTEPTRVDVPPSLLSRTWDFNVTLNAPASDATIHNLVRDAIASRFHVAIAPETRAMDVFVLSAPGGPSPAMAKLPDVTGATHSSSSVSMVGNSVTARGAAMTDLCRLLEETLKRPVLDETNLAARYNFNTHDSDVGPEALTRSLRQQLGLVLSPARRELTIIVVRPL